MLTFTTKLVLVRQQAKSSSEFLIQFRNPYMVGLQYLKFCKPESLKNDMKLFFCGYL